jgi:cytochrome P450
MISTLQDLPMTPLYIVGYVALAIWAGFSAMFMYLFITRKWAYRKFKSNFTVPVLGNCYTADALSFMKYLATLRKKHGRVFTVWPFSKVYLVIADPVVVRRVLSDHKTFIKGGDYKDIFSVGFGQGLVTSSGEKHTKDRAIFSKYFVKANVTKYAGIINTSTKDCMHQKLDVLMPAGTDGPVECDMEPFFAVLSLRCFLRFSMNTTFDETKEERLCHLVSRGSWATARMMSLNLPMWDIFWPVSLIRYAKGQVWLECEKAIQRRQAELAAGTAEDIDDCLSAVIREKMSDKDVIDHVMTLVCAGHDTTAFFSAFMMLLLAQHPEIQERVRAEIFEKMGDKQEISMEDVAELKFLQKVMQETLRLYAVIPMVTREATEEVTVKEAGVTIPKGANVMVPFFLLNRDPTVWENPGVFNPDRFDEKATSGTEFTSAKNGFFPFGYGSRTCIGNTLAQTENGIFMCHLLRSYKFTPQPGFKPSIFGGISLTTSNGIKVRIERLKR